MKHANFPKSWGQTFVAFIPKIPNSKHVADFCPISLCNICYKIISKLLANRLSIVLPKLIGKEQAGFVKGCTSVDHIIVIHEVVHSLNNSFRDSPRMTIKVNIEKAYDLVSWEVILVTLAKMGFHIVWITWIKLVFCFLFSINKWSFNQFYLFFPGY